MRLSIVVAGVQHAVAAGEKYSERAKSARCFSFEGLQRCKGCKAFLVVLLLPQDSDGVEGFIEPMNHYYPVSYFLIIGPRLMTMDHILSSVT